MALVWLLGMNYNTNMEQSPLTVNTREPLGSSWEAGDAVMKINTASTTQANPQQNIATMLESWSPCFMYVGNIGESKKDKAAKRHKTEITIC